MQEITVFYKNYVRLCAEKGKSLSAVAEEIGLSRTSPNGWKKGKIPNDTTKAKLANYFEISVAFLMGLEEKETPTSVSEDGLAGTKYDLLTPEHQKIVNSLIEQLLASQSPE